MTTPTSPQEGELPTHERRRYPRYYVSSRLMLVIEDLTLKESIGMCEPGDISLGGVRVKNLHSSKNVKVGDQLKMLLLDPGDALTLNGEVVHQGTPGTFGVQFQDLTGSDQNGVRNLIGRLHSKL